MKAIQATLRLFNAVQVSDEDHISNVTPQLLKRSVSHGYLLGPTIQCSDGLLDVVESIVGISGEKANASFHKSWQVVQDTPMEILFIQQVIHYITTYGFEALGIYDERLVYIPHEQLDLPAITENIPLVFIKGMTRSDILKAIVDLGSGNVALAQETLDDIMTIVETNKYDQHIVDCITNRELKALLCDLYGIVPSEPIEFLRHLVSKLTNESLLIKNEYLIDKIKEANGKFLDVLIQDAPDDLASIFFRFKPLFLAMKSISGNKTFFNRLRKQANKMHKPMPIDYLNSVTHQLKNGVLDFNVLEKKLESASVFRKIRLAYALKHRVNPGDSIVYRVRNGRGWATEFEWPHKAHYTTLSAFSTVVKSIVRDVQKNVDGKTVYIPENVHYALPATEKQFVGNLPSGSYVSVPDDLIVGIHWENTDERVDIDLSVIGESGKIGWDSRYRSDDSQVLFSGDVVDAPLPKGASELFYIRNAVQENRLLIANYYDFNKGDEVQCKILAAREKPRRMFGENYMVDVGNIVASANVNINKKQTVLGLIANVQGRHRVYFANISIGNSVTSTSNEQSTQTRKYLVRSLVNSIELCEILNMANATVVSERPDSEYIDLSPEALDKAIILDLFK